MVISLKPDVTETLSEFIDKSIDIFYRFVICEKLNQVIKGQMWYVALFNHYSNLEGESMKLLL